MVIFIILMVVGLSVWGFVVFFTTKAFVDAAKNKEERPDYKNTTTWTNNS